MRRKLLQFQSVLAQHALRAAPKPRLPQLQPLSHNHFLHSPSAPASASPFQSAQLLWSRLAGATDAAVLPRSAAAVVAAARSTSSRVTAAAARGASSLELFSLQRRRTSGSGWPSAASAFAQGSRSQWMKFSADGVVLMIIGANVAVFMLWRLADPDFMRRHFTISLDNFKSGRLHTLLTSAFSHTQTSHLFSNMFGFYFFGASIASAFGPAFLLNLYVAGALAGAAFFLLDKAFLAPRKRGYVGWDPSRAPGLGASAAVNAIILLDIFLHPKSLVYLYFVIPIPAAVMGAALIGADLYRVQKGQGHSSGFSHLGGALVAALVWARIRKGWI